MWSRNSVRPRTASPSSSASSASGAARPSEPGTRGAFIGRLEESEAALRAVRHPILAGAVIVGTPGSGKTALLQHIQGSLGDSHIVPVRGVASAASFPFRALSPLLAEVPAAGMHPALVVNAVAKHLREQADGRRIVFAVDNAEHLDESSAVLLGQLAAGRAASLLLTATDFTRADDAFVALWRASSLRRIELEPFSLEDTRQFVELRLAAPVSREVADAASAVGGGNPRAIRGALRAYTQKGVIARRGTAWVLLPGRPGTGEDIVAHFPLLHSLTPGQRALANLLALAGPLGWSDLAEDTDPADIDALQDAGLLVIDSLAAPRAALATPGLSAALAEVVGRQEAAGLLVRIEKSPTARRRLLEDPARHVSWMLRAGRVVEDHSAVAAASALNDDGDHEGAAHLIDSIGVGTSTGLAYQGLVAAVGLGQVREATTHAHMLSRAGARMDAREWTLYKIAESRLNRLSTERGRAEPADAAGPLADAELRLAGWREEAQAAGDAPRLTDLDLLRRRLVVARAEVASFEGRFGDTLALLDGVVPADAVLHAGTGTRREADTRSLQVAVEALSLEASLVLNRDADADALATSLAMRLADPALPVSCVDAALVRTGVAALTKGPAHEAAHPLANPSESPDRWSFQRGSLAALGDAVALMREGRLAEASTLLMPAVEQLRIADPHGVFSLAASVLAYGHAVAESTAKRPARAALPEGGRGDAWIVRRASLHYQLLTAARQGDSANAARQLQERASSDLEQGADAWALLSLGTAVRMGREEAVADLRSLAARLDGPLARTLEAYARALPGGDVDGLVEAMESAAAGGNLRLVADIAQSGIIATTRNQDDAGVRLIQQRLSELVPEAAPVPAAASPLDLLTAREREIAVAAAAGRRNRAIAAQLFVSVRTVEGHLYQVFSKLNVGSRAELAQLLEAGVAEPPHE